MESNSLNESKSYSDDSVDLCYNSRITFDSTQEKSKNEANDSKSHLESGFHDKLSTKSQPTSSNPSEFFVPSNLEHVSVDSINTAENSLNTKNDNSIINKSSLISEIITEPANNNNDDVFLVDYETKNVTNDFMLKKKQNKSNEKRKTCQPTILEEDNIVDENILAKDISSLKIPSYFRSKTPFKISNDENFMNLSPDINSLNTEIFDRNKIKNLLHESDIERINASNILTTSTPLINLKNNGNFKNFLNGISLNNPQSKMFALKTIIDELTYAKKRLLTAQKCYFDKQIINMNAGWNNLDEAIRDFQKQKNEEYAKIAEIRSTLADETKKKSTKEDAKRINELETEIQKLKDEEIKRTRQLSEWRVKFNNSEAALKVHKEESEKRLNQTIELQKMLAKAQTEISNLRVKLNLVKEREKEAKEKGLLNTATKKNHENGYTNASLLKRNLSAPNTSKDSTSSSTYYNYVKDLTKPKNFFTKRSVRWSSPLTTSQSFNNLNELPATFIFPGPSQRNIIAEMMNTKFEMTERGNEYTFTNGPTILLCTELKCHCRLYEWNNGNFSWAFRMQRQRVEIDYFASIKALEIWTPRENRFVLFFNKQFEIHWRNGDKTIITPDGKRLEVFWQTINENDNLNEEEEDVQFEMHEDIGCVKWSITAQPEEFFPDNKREGNRGQDAYTSILDSFSYSINCFDFKLRRLNADGYTKLFFPNISLQLNLCIIDSVFSIKHVINCENNIKEKRDCYVFGSCNHISRN